MAYVLSCMSIEAHASAEVARILLMGNRLSALPSACWWQVPAIREASVTRSD
jgi:hypothetical protein